LEKAGSQEDIDNHLLISDFVILSACPLIVESRHMIGNESVRIPHVYSGDHAAIKGRGFDDKRSISLPKSVLEINNYSIR